MASAIKSVWNISKRSDRWKMVVPKLFIWGCPFFLRPAASVRSASLRKFLKKSASYGKNYFPTLQRDQGRGEVPTGGQDEVRRDRSVRKQRTKRRKKTERLSLIGALLVVGCWPDMMWQRLSVVDGRCQNRFFAFVFFHEFFPVTNLVFVEFCSLVFPTVMAVAALFFSRSDNVHFLFFLLPSHLLHGLLPCCRFISSIIVLIVSYYWSTVVLQTMTVSWLAATPFSFFLFFCRLRDKFKVWRDTAIHGMAGKAVQPPPQPHLGGGQAVGARVHQTCGASPSAGSLSQPFEAAGESLCGVNARRVVGVTWFFVRRSLRDNGP